MLLPSRQQSGLLNVRVHRCRGAMKESLGEPRGLNPCVDEVPVNSKGTALGLALL